MDNLLDAAKNPPAGSLRWAIEQPGTRTVVFAVSGTIALAAPLRIRQGDLTIAGQTAPGDGICLKDYVTNVEASNVIIRYLRFRCGNEKLTSDAQDALNCVRQHDVIIDHCSMSWSVDEVGSFYDNQRFTLQWCLLSESLYAAGHKKGDHGFGGIWGGQGVSFHHNLLASHTSRNPRFCGSRYTRRPDDEQVDFRNNVVFNWGFQSIYGGEGGNQNVVNNYFKPGPATKKGAVQYRIMELTAIYYDATVRPDTLGAGRFYVAGNVVEGFPAATNDNWGVGVQTKDLTAKAHAKAEQAFVVAPVNTQSANDAYESVLQQAGARLPRTDAVDARILAQVRSGQCTVGGKWGANTGIIDAATQVGGWPILNTGTVPPDTDKDGMPDTWETAHHLNPNNPTDGAQIAKGSAYTNLELYLNSL
ncbi:pectate lyase [Fibrella aestuarina]|uniref:pectate lyase n=1 Tax=Fibrella aestuarina TaxID=651143 RepID=UPI001E601A6A|nr:pectate lyase [Fibrella aestuarina]